MGIYVLDGISKGHVVLRELVTRKQLKSTLQLQSSLTANDGGQSARPPTPQAESHSIVGLRTLFLDLTPLDAYSPFRNGNENENSN